MTALFVRALLPVAVVLGTTVPIGGSGRAFAQEARAETEDGPKAQEIQAVERGAFCEVDAGLAYIVNKLDGRSYGLTTATGVFFGYDVLPMLSVSLGGVALAASASIDENTPTPRGDLLFLAPMLQVQFSFITTERNSLWGRAGAGFGFGLPEEIDGQAHGGLGPMFLGSVGFERYTRLRHFSIGVEAGAFILTKPAVAVAVSVLPLVKYTF